MILWILRPSNNKAESFAASLIRDAATGRILAESDFFPVMSPGIVVTPGYGGLLYDVHYNGHIMALQVAPAHATAGNSTGVVNGWSWSHCTDDKLYTSRLTYLLKVAARKTGQKKLQETRHEHAM